MTFDDNGAKSLEWYQQNHAPEYTIPELLSMAAQVDAGCEGLSALPCAGAYPGLTGFVHIKNRQYQHGHYVRAILESTAHSLFALVKALKNDSPLPPIVSSGGGSRSELWVTIKSDIIHSSLPADLRRGRALIPACTESACLGAAMMGALGTNLFGSYEDIVEAWVRLASPALCGSIRCN